MGWGEFQDRGPLFPVLDDSFWSSLPWTTWLLGEHTVLLSRGCSLVFLFPWNSGSWGFLSGGEW